MRQCDECGQSVDKIHRVYKKNNFCHTCYVRVFKKRNCPSCGVMVRLSKYDNSAICQKCENNRPCIRCQRIDYSIGKNTNHGPVCKSCSVYFRELRACEYCGVFSQKLSRINRFADNLRVCPKCATRDYKTCSSCGRYRLLEVEPLSGKTFCKKCLTDSPHHCLTCMVQIPAGRGNYCEICSWKQTLERRVNKLIKKLDQQNLQNYFKDYVIWLSKEIGPHKAALLLTKHISFFEETNTLWNKHVPIYDVLLQKLRPSGLRRYQLPLRWLITIHNLKIDQQLKLYYSELDQIRKLVNVCSDGTISAQILHEYYNVLIEKVKKDNITLRSARLAMKPASALMLRMNKSRFELPKMWHIKHYLADYPGQAASIIGFINFLNKRYKTDLSYEFIKHSSFFESKSSRKLEKEIIKIIMANDDSFDLSSWVKICLRYFHKLNITNFNKIEESMIEDVEDGLIINFGNENYWLPKKSNFKNMNKINYNNEVLL